MKVLAALLMVAAVVGMAEGGLTVVTQGGRLQGTAEKSISGRTFHSFYSIPYARPPIGAYRFKDPVKPGTWQRLADATRMPSPCLQVPFGVAAMGIRLKPKEMLGAENCLFLNVFTPETGQAPENAKLPVMVWLHGGAFFSGSAEEYLPHTFLDHDVVLVVVQYRLGVLGFLSTEDSIMPGNLGLKDQTIALEWVQRNIHVFGGDKTRVTIFGESAGGASVHLQMLTPKSRGLFSQAIMQSGTALGSWAMNSRHREEAVTLGRSVGCKDVQNSTALLTCLQKVNANELAAAVQNTFQWYLTPLVFSARVDKDFLPDHPAKLILDKQYSEVDLLAGVTQNEGALATIPMFANRELITKLEENFAVNGPITLGIENEKNSSILAKTLYEHYMGDITFDAAHGEQITQLYSDIAFNLFHDEVTARHAAHFPDRRTFRYQFDYRGDTGLFDVFGSKVGTHWICHGDDLIYLFAGGTMLDPIFPKGLTSPDDVRMRKMMVKMWVNFATSGNPTPDASLGFKWEPTIASNLNYLSITSSPAMQPDNRKKAREFFASLPLFNWKILYSEKQQQQQGTKTERIAQEEL